MYNANLRHEVLAAIKLRPMSTRELSDLTGSSGANIVSCARKIPGVYVAQWLPSKMGRPMAQWAWSETPMKDAPFEKAPRRD